MTIDTIQATADAEIRQFLESWAQAARAKDIGAIMSHYLPEVRAFDAIGQLQFKGAEAYGAHWETCLTMCEGPMIIEIHELDITLRDDAAFCHYLSRCGGTGPDGKEQTGWMRATVCLRKTNGRWGIAHEHFSAPFDPASGKAIFDLEP